MQTITFDLPKLLRLIRDNKFQIPQFQRPFRWRTSQVKLLIDSLIRSYPVGSLLVMGKNPEMPLRARTIEASIAADEAPDIEIPVDGSEDIKETYLVLDGQQRLTSIARVFLNADPKRSYYFDLKEMLATFGDRSQEDDDLPWIKAYTKGKRDPERKKKNRWLRADVALEVQKSSIYLSEYVEDSEDFAHLDKNARRRETARLSELFEALRKYQVPIVSIDSEVGIESVCRVFETINSTGTRLTTFDLAVARYFPNPDLRQLLNVAKERFSILEEFGIDGDRILQVVALRAAYISDTRFAEPSRTALLSLQGATIDAEWPTAAESLANAYLWARSQGARPETLPSSSILVAIAGLLSFEPQILSDISKGFSSTLRRWYFTRVLREGATSGANAKIAADFGDLMRYAKHGASLTFHDVLFTRESIGQLITAQDNRYKALQCVIAIHAREDLVTQHRINDDSTIEYHHIFPRALARPHAIGSVIDSIANQIAVLKESNRKISDTPPAEYLGKLNDSAGKHGTLADFRRRLECSLLPFADRVGTEAFARSFEPSAYGDFVKARSSLLIDRIRELIGDSFVERESPEVDEDDQVETAA